jgi:hypothetical protein
VSNLNAILNRIYCLSQKAQYTVGNLRSYPHVAKNTYSYLLCEYLDNLNMKTLRAFTDIQLSSLHEDFHIYLDDLFSESSGIEETYAMFIKSIDLESDHILIKKLKSQIDSILVMLIKLTLVSCNSKIYDDIKIGDTKIKALPK